MLFMFIFDGVLSDTINVVWMRGLWTDIDEELVTGTPDGTDGTPGGAIEDTNPCDTDALLLIDGEKAAVAIGAVL